MSAYRQLLGISLFAILVGAPPPSAGATNTQALLTSALHNTNTVRTLVHKDAITTTAQGLKVSATARGEEDEVHNREQDTESVTVQITTQGGAVRKVHYTLALIFLNGHTYYRASQLGTRWHTRQGMTFPDPVLGAEWKRARTTVQLSKGLKLSTVGGVSGSQIHYHGTVHNSQSSESVDLWISVGKAPYVVREVDKRQTTTGRRVMSSTQIDFGPFNGPLNIQPPQVGAIRSL